MKKLTYAAALFCSLFCHHHAPHAAHVDVELVIRHAAHRRSVVL